MMDSLEQLLLYTKRSVGDAINDHDPIARVRPVDVYAVKVEIERLRLLLPIVSQCHHRGMTLRAHDATLNF